MHEAGYVHPYPIQRACLDLTLAGKSIVAQAQTGSGKSLAFAIQMLQAVDETIPMQGVQVICIAPTRELARMLYNDTLYPLLKKKPTICHRLMIPEEQNPKEGHSIYLADFVAQKWLKGEVEKTYPDPAKNPENDRVDLVLENGRRVAGNIVGPSDVRSATIVPATCRDGYPHIVVGTPGTIKSAITSRKSSLYYLPSLCECILFVKINSDGLLATRGCARF